MVRIPSEAVDVTKLELICEQCDFVVHSPVKKKK